VFVYKKCFLNRNTYARDEGTIEKLRNGETEKQRNESREKLKKPPREDAETRESSVKPYKNEIRF
jgi:hypothetical protein